jgi:hypothetical protein
MDILIKNTVSVQFEEIYVEPLTKSAAIKCVASKIASFKPILNSQSCGTTQIFSLENVARLAEYELAEICLTGIDDIKLQKIKIKSSHS